MGPRAVGVSSVLTGRRPIRMDAKRWSGRDVGAERRVWPVVRLGPIWHTDVRARVTSLPPEFRDPLESLHVRTRSPSMVSPSPAAPGPCSTRVDLVVAAPATGSASSAPTASASRRCSRLLRARCRSTPARSVSPPPTAHVGWLRQEPDRSDETVRDLLHRRTGVAAAQIELDAARRSPCAESSRRRRPVRPCALQRWLALGAADLDARIGSVAAELGLSRVDWSTNRPRRCRAARRRVPGSRRLLLSRVRRVPARRADQRPRPRRARPARAAGCSDSTAPDAARQPRPPVPRPGRSPTSSEIDEFTHRVRCSAAAGRPTSHEREVARRHAWERFDEYDTKRRSLADRAQRQREWAQQGQRQGATIGRDEPDKNIRAFKIDQTEQLAGKAAQTKRAIERLDVVDKPREPWELRLEVPDAPRSGDVVARLTGVHGRAGDVPAGPDRPADRVRRADRARRPQRCRQVDVDRRRSSGAPRPTLGVGDARAAASSSGEIEQVRAQLDRRPAAVAGRSWTRPGWMSPTPRTLLAKFGLVGDHVDRPPDRSRRASGPERRWRC